MGLDLREFVLHVVRIHRLDLLPRRSSKYLDDLYELINSALSGEEWLAEHQFGHDATRRPDIYWGETSD